MDDINFFDDDVQSAEDDFGFDFADDLSVRSDMILAYTAPTTEVSPALSAGVINASEGQRAGAIVVSSTQRTGSKFKHKRAAPYPPKLALRPTPSFVGVKTPQPNMSRRTRDLRLYAFPSFDRCDSLLFFPSTLARYMNSGNLDGVTKLLADHFDRYCSNGCAVNDTTQPGLTAKCIVAKIQFLEQLQPDRITCMRSTVVVGNTIKSVLYAKHTNVPAITAGILGSSDAYLYTEQNLRRRLQHENYPPEDRKQYLALIDSGCDLSVYSRMDLELVVDEMTKKVKHFNTTVTPTSIQEAKSAVYDTVHV